MLPTHHASHDVLAERRLWCAVIEQAFMDIGVITQPRAARSEYQGAKLRGVYAGKEYYDATNWLLLNRKDFYYVCLLAGVCPSVIREAARRVQ